MALPEWKNEVKWSEVMNADSVVAPFIGYFMAKLPLPDHPTTRPSVHNLWTASGAPSPPPPWPLPTWRSGCPPHRSSQPSCRTSSALYQAPCPAAGYPVAYRCRRCVWSRLDVEEGYAHERAAPTGQRSHRPIYTYYSTVDVYLLIRRAKCDKLINVFLP